MLYNFFKYYYYQYCAKEDTCGFEFICFREPGPNIFYRVHSVGPASLLVTTTKHYNM